MVLIPTSITNYLQATPELAGSCLQTSALMTSESGITLGPTWSKKTRKTEDELVTEHQLGPVTCYTLLE